LEEVANGIDGWTVEGMARAHGITGLADEMRPLVAAGESVMDNLDSGAVWLPYEPEVAYYYDPATNTAGRLDSWGHRDYSAAPEGAYACTLDLVSLPTEDPTEAMVLDWKTGELDPGDAADNAQLRMGALCVALANPVVKSVTVILAWLRPGGPVVDEYEYSADELLRFASVLQGSHERMRLGLTDPCPGPHCSSLWCPIRATCPATTAALAKLGGTRLSGVIQDEDHAAWTLGRLGAVKEAIKDIEAAGQGWAAEHGDIPMPGGKVWGPFEKSRESVHLDTAGAMAALEGLTVAELDKAAPRKTSKAALTKALGKDRAKDVLGRLRAEGAIHRGTYTSWGIHKA